MQHLRAMQTISNELLTDVQIKKGSDYHLVITLTNKSNHSLTAYRTQLPWGARYSMILVAVKTDAFGTPIETVFSIDDPSAEVIKINKNGKLEGKISLIDRFPGFLMAIQEYDIIVFWSYQLQTTNGDLTKRRTGSVLFKKQFH
jgi:hypothetical protein